MTDIDTNSAPPRHHGKFRATCVDNIDPLMLGRIQVAVPEVMDGVSSWAMPCVPVSGIQSDDLYRR